MPNGRRRLLGQRHIVLAVITFVLIAAGTVVATFLPQDRYESTAVISVEPADPTVSTQLVNFLIPTVEARIEGQALASEVASRLPGSLAEAGWDVSTSVEPGSGVMRITVASDNRDVPLVAANGYAQVLDQQIPGTEVLDAVVIDLAARTIVVSQRSTILVSGLSLALILAFLVGMALRRPNLSAHSIEGSRETVHGPLGMDGPVRYVERVQSGR